MSPNRPYYRLVHRKLRAFHPAAVDSCPRIRLSSALIQPRRPFAAQQLLVRPLSKAATITMGCSAERTFTHPRSCSVLRRDLFLRDSPCENGYASNRFLPNPLSWRSALPSINGKNLTSSYRNCSYASASWSNVHLAPGGSQPGYGKTLRVTTLLSSLMPLKQSAASRYWHLASHGKPSRLSTLIAKRLVGTLPQQRLALPSSLGEKLVALNANRNLRSLPEAAQHPRPHSNRITSAIRLSHRPQTNKNRCRKYAKRRSSTSPVQ